MMIMDFSTLPNWITQVRLQIMKFMDMEEKKGYIFLINLKETITMVKKLLVLSNGNKMGGIMNIMDPSILNRILKERVIY